MAYNELEENSLSSLFKKLWETFPAEIHDNSFICLFFWELNWTPLIFSRPFWNAASTSWKCMQLPRFFSRFLKRLALFFWGTSYLFSGFLSVYGTVRQKLVIDFIMFFFIPAVVSMVMYLLIAAKLGASAANPQNVWLLTASSFRVFANWAHLRENTIT